MPFKLNCIYLKTSWKIEIIVDIVAELQDHSVKKQIAQIALEIQVLPQCCQRLMVDVNLFKSCFNSRLSGIQCDFWDVIQTIRFYKNRVNSGSTRQTKVCFCGTPSDRLLSICLCFPLFGAAAKLCKLLNKIQTVSSSFSEARKYSNSIERTNVINLDMMRYSHSEAKYCLSYFLYFIAVI